jgi:hypothetical protein
MTSTSVFNNTLKLIQHESWRGTQVKHLVIRACDPDEFNGQISLDLFPNLRFIYLDSCVDLLLESSNPFRMPLEKIGPLMGQIEHIVDYADCEFTHQLLSLGICPNLVTLELELTFSYRPSDRIIPLLANAPYLTKLELKRFHFMMNDLEWIHGHLPLLHTFILENGSVMIDDVPDNLVPAKSVTTLFIDNVGVDLASKRRWFLYMSKKYTQVQHFKLVSFNFLVADDNDEEFDQVGLLYLAQTFGSQLKSLELSQTLLPNVLGKMDTFGCHLQKLDIYPNRGASVIQDLALSHQSKHIQELKLRYVDRFPLELLKHFESLVQLDVIFNHYRNRQGKAVFKVVHLGQLLKSCPDTLESLRIEYASLELDTDDAARYPLKKLAIKSPELPRGMDRFLSNCCPQIHSLILKGCVPADTSLILPNLCLSYLEIEPENKNIVSNWLVLTSKGRNQFYYHIGGAQSYINSTETSSNNSYNKILYNAYRPVSYELLQGKAITTIHCSSLHTLILNNQLAC